jgi:hypothetical protein
MSTSFLSRLDDATSSLQAERKDITPVKDNGGTKGSGSKHDTPIRKIDFNKNDHSPQQNDDYGVGVGLDLDDDADSKETNVNDDEEDLVSKCSEYIFDLFDANMLEDYHTVANFENKALDAFIDPSSTEISFAQELLHKEFLELFEGLIAKFLKENNATPEVFYAQVQSYLDLKNDPSGKGAEILSKKHTAKQQDANEVVDCIFHYTDLNLWCESMRERASMRCRYLRNISRSSHEEGSGSGNPRSKGSGGAYESMKQKTQLEEIAERAAGYRGSAATAHRFDCK